jgi:hypothetical protein
VLTAVKAMQTQSAVLAWASPRATVLTAVKAMQTQSAPDVVFGARVASTPIVLTAVNTAQTQSAA